MSGSLFQVGYHIYPENLNIETHNLSDNSNHTFDYLMMGLYGWMANSVDCDETAPLGKEIPTSIHKIGFDIKMTKWHKLASKYPFIWSFAVTSQGAVWSGSTLVLFAIL